MPPPVLLVAGLPAESQQVASATPAAPGCCLAGARQAGAARVAAAAPLRQRMCPSQRQRRGLVGVTRLCRRLLLLLLLFLRRLCSQPERVHCNFQAPQLKRRARAGQRRQCLKQRRMLRPLQAGQVRRKCGRHWPQGCKGSVRRQPQGAQRALWYGQQWGGWVASDSKYGGWLSASQHHACSHWVTLCFGQQSGRTRCCKRKRHGAHASSSRWAQQQQQEAACEQRGPHLLPVPVDGVLQARDCAAQHAQQAGLVGQAARKLRP